MKLVEGGLVERWEREIFPKSQCEIQEINVEATTISVEDLAGNFILLLGGLGVALFLLILEVIVMKCCKKLQCCKTGILKTTKCVDGKEPKAKTGTSFSDTQLDDASKTNYAENEYSYGIHKHNGDIIAVNGAVKNREQLQVVDLEEGLNSGRYVKRLRKAQHASDISLPTTRKSQSHHTKTDEQTGARTKVKNKNLELL